jgi:hypothetical protein
MKILCNIFYVKETIWEKSKFSNMLQQNVNFKTQLSFSVLRMKKSLFPQKT